MDNMPRIVLVGRPNVGKSTLFNRLTGSKNALVAPAPGLTRDRRYGLVRMDGVQFEIIDTGGLDYSLSGDQMARLVMDQGLKAIEEADIVLLILDAKDGLIGPDKDIANRLRSYKKPIVTAVNKVDNSRSEGSIGEFYELGMEEIIPVSAEHGRNIPELIKKLAGVAVSLGLNAAEGQLEPINEVEVESGLEVPADAPIRLSIIGRPNVGKSSLFNRLAGEPRMIVSDVAGTTRDAIDTLLKRPAGRDILLTDTAGIRRKARVSDKIEKFSIIKAIDAIKACDIALVVLDAVEGITDQDKRLIGYAEEYRRAVITVFNKWDLVQADKSLARLRTEELKESKRFIGYSPHMDLSALTGKNVKRLLPIIDEVYGEFIKAVGTGRANQVLQKAMALRSPQIAKGHHLKLYYTTQVAVGPPTFLIFANYPGLVPNHYIRFLENQFRAQLDISRTPVRIIFRERERRK